MMLKNTYPYFNVKRFSIIRQLLALLTFLSLSLAGQATNYYFSSSTGNDSYTSTQAQNAATPWKSISKLNSFFSSLVAGDNIYFKRGDTFYGCIVVNKSGSSGSLITISAYGTGNKPIISGLTTLSTWTAVSGGVFQAAAPAVKNTVNLVTLNGIPQAVGRYPNADAANGGYLTYESYSGTTSITDNQLTSATNWTGAEVVIRKQHYMMEKCKITNHAGTVISYSTTASINPLNTPTPKPINGSNGYGYFIQRDARTLDQLGEWYFNTTTKNMQMYFGSNSPSSYTIRVSTLDTLVNIGKYNYINVNNISFEGANATAIYAANAGNLTIRSCDMNLMGGKGIIFFNSPNLIVDSITSNYALCGAIDLTARYQANATVSNCTIKNTAMIAGMGSFWDDNDYKAISVTVTTGATIANNSIEKTGYVAIQFQGNGIMVKNNFINYYDMVKDDGGGIYTYQSGTDASPGTVYTNRVIQNNIILNGIGATPGTGGDLDVDGIYLDGRTTNVDVLNNTMANIGVNGIYTVNPHNVNIRGNTCFNNGSVIGITRNSWSSTSNLTVKQNIFYPKYSTQNNLDYVNTGINVPTTSTIETAMQGIGAIDSNYYSTPNATGFNYRYELVEGGAWTFPKPLPFEGWKSKSNHDKVTKLPATKVVLYKLDGLIGANLAVNGQFTSNISSVSTYSPTSNVTTSWDNTTKINGTGSLKLAPTTASTDFTMVYGSIGSVTSAKKYILRFTTLGSLTNGVVKAYIRKSASPNTVLTPVQTANFGTSKVTHEFLFNAPTAEAAASFVFEVQQASGITYIDDIQFYEANATIFNIDDQLRFEYNATNAAKTIALGANYTGVDGTAYKGSLTLQPFTSKILIKDTGTVTVTLPPPSSLTAAASANDISCFGGYTTVTVTGAGGTAPYTGTGSYTVYAGTGSLKISVASPIANTSTLLYSTIGAVSSSKNYLLKFSTLGTTASGSLKVYLRQTASPYSTITPIQTKTFGTARIDHQFLFTGPTTQAAASFLIELLQTSGTTYIDNIAVFEATSAGVPISANLYNSGQFEGSISGITTWSNTNNHLATLDLTSKISNIYYYPVKDANGATAVASKLIIQPNSPLSATATSPNVTVTGGAVTVVVSATGGTAPYTGTGSFANVKVGTYSYPVTDAKGCTATAVITVKQASTARISSTGADSIATRSLSTDLAVQTNTQLSINTYPNPATTEFNLTIKGGSSEMVDVAVSSIDGKIVFKTQGASNKKYTFGNSFMTGMYIIRVTQGNTILTAKVIKIK